MGCAESRTSINSTPQGLQKLKMENGYVKGRFLEARRSTGQRNFPKQRPSRKSSGSGSSGSRGGGGGGHEGKLTTRETQRDGDGGGDGSGGGGGSGKISQKIASFNLGEEDELVDGWPKWLTDHIPRDVLAGIVPKSAESYDKLDKVGQGTYSNVYKARDKDTGKIVALKKVRFDRSESESVKFMAREIVILQKLDHPNIVKLVGLATSRMQYSLYLVFDYMQTDLARIISRPEERLTEPQVKCYMHQLLSGLQHCHERGILHRDIKGSNLLIDKNGMLKIADFGLANYFDPNRKVHLTSRVVTLWYRAPELLLGATDYGVGIDLWSAGCLLAEMLEGRPILPGRTEVEQLHRIFKLCGAPSEDYWKRMKLSTTFRPPHAYKPSLLEAFRDYPESSLGLLNILIALDPARRGSAASALQNKFFYTSPLACDLPGLPVIYKEGEEPVQNIQRRRHRNPKTRERSLSQPEPQKNDLVMEKPEADDSSSKEEAEKRSELNSGQGSSATSNSSSMKRSTDPQEGSPPAPPLPSPAISSSQRKISTNSEAHSNAANNTKNLPPLPNGKTRTVKCVQHVSIRSNPKVCVQRRIPKSRSEETSYTTSG